MTKPTGCEFCGYHYQKPWEWLTHLCAGLIESAMNEAFKKREEEEKWTF